MKTIDWNSIIPFLMGILICGVFFHSANVYAHPAVPVVAQKANFLQNKKYFELIWEMYQDAVDHHSCQYSAHLLSYEHLDNGEVITKELREMAQRAFVASNCFNRL